MTGFSFPPPPPPPPKAASSQQPEPVYNLGRGGARGGRGGRGDRGGFRGRGGQQQRGGRPQQSYSPQNFGQTGNAAGVGYDGNQQSNQSYAPQNFSQTGNLNSSNYGGNQQSYGGQQGNYQQNYNMPAGAYVNPAFNAGQNQYQASASQYGPSRQYGQRDQPVNNYQNSSFSPGQKRSREQAFGHANNKHPMKKPPSAPKVPAPPAVPSFGAPIPLPPKPSAPVSAATSKTANEKKRVSLFGLSSEGGAADVVAEDSEGEDEDVDEEAAYATNLSSGPLKIEYNGETLSLESQAELAEWLAERKRFFPTKQRIEEKKSEVQMRMEERRRIERETRAAAAAADPGSLLAKSLPGQRDRTGREKERERKQKDRKTNPRNEQQQRPAQKPESSLDDARRELEMQMQKVQELQRLLAESEKKAAAVGAAKEPATDETSTADVAMSDAVDAPAGEAIQPESEVLKVAAVVEEEAGVNPASSEALQALEAALDVGEEPLVEPAVPTQAADDESSSSHSFDSDGDAPEETTSKHDGRVRVAPPNSERPPCSVFARTGQCRFGPKCRFKHVASEQTREKRSETGTAKRKTLFQRLVEQERDEENRVVLQAIKYLGGVGFFSKR